MATSHVRSQRYLIRVQIETTAPLAIGSGKTGIMNQRLIARDANDLPYLPGSSLAGVLRHALLRAEGSSTGFSQEKLDQWFGYQQGDKGHGSHLICSAGLLIGRDGITVLEGLSVDRTQLPPLLDVLPERDHVRINHQGVADERGKFMEELVPTGTRFVFEIELKSRWKGVERSDKAKQTHQEDHAFFRQLIDTLQDRTFRLGAGTRKGFGAWQVIDLAYRHYDLTQAEDRAAYLGQSSSLTQPLTGATHTSGSIRDANPAHWASYNLTLHPQDFFFFGSGDVAFEPGERKDETEKGTWLDMVPKQERRIVWEPTGDALAATVKDSYLLPGTSIKGALAHRVAYHYNRLAKNTVENSGNLAAPMPSFDIESALRSLTLPIKIEDMNFPADSEEWDTYRNIVEAFSPEAVVAWEEFLQQMEEVEHGRTEHTALPVGSDNPAVRALFGYATNDNEASGENGRGDRGHVLIPDIYLDVEKVQRKRFNHVAIDRFTGGALDGALFEEDVLSHPQEEGISLHILVETQAFSDPQVKEAFDLALADLQAGNLPLGGNSTKGHGLFTATLQPS